MNATIAGASSQKVTFKGAFGNELAARLELPARPPIAFALFAHCFTCSKDTLAAARISKSLTAFGIAVLRFDFTGLGNSQGDFANTNFSSNVADLLKAVTFLREHYAAPQLLIGHSLGGAAILVASQQIPETKGIVTIGTPADLSETKLLLADKLEEITAKGEAEVVLGGRKFQVKKQFVDDLDKHRLINVVSQLNKPLIVFHSPEDDIVGIENAQAIFNAAPYPKNFISLAGADHLLTRKEDASYVASVLANWITRYLPMPIDADTQQNSPDETIVRESGKGRLVQEIMVGKHLLFADEPIANGGNDLGPTPYDFILSALGACTAMTIRLYADFKHFPLEKIIVKLKHSKNHAVDCTDCENGNTKIDHIDRLIILQGNLSQEQRQKLLDIANKCPVHRTLTSKIEIATKLIE